MQVDDVTNFLGITNYRRNEPVIPSGKVFDLSTAGEKKVLHTWKAITRQNKKMNTKLAKNVVIILVVVALLLIAMQEFLLIGLIASIIFVYYVLSATPSEEVTHVVTTHGVSFAGEFYYWHELKYYFFKKQDAFNVLCADTVTSLPGRLYFLIDDKDKTALDGYFGTYLPKLEEEPSDIITDARNFVSARFNFDDTSN
ncbi:MAG: hypothetical protein ACOZAO_01105 [Patescibacteria group bacterium]